MPDGFGIGTDWLEFASSSWHQVYLEIELDFDRPPYMVGEVGVGALMTVDYDLDIDIDYVDTCDCSSANGSEAFEGQLEHMQPKHIYGEDRIVR